MVLLCAILISHCELLIYSALVVSWEDLGRNENRWDGSLEFIEFDARKKSNLLI